MQIFIYIIFIIILAVVIYGAISRKRIYGEVDRLEAWKIQIMNKPVTDEIAKIKGLNMSGETETKFESWRNKWDEILTTKLPDLEEKLFDVEEAANKYRFVKAKNLVKNIVNELNNIEASLQEMLADVHMLINSEENNRKQSDDLRQVFKDVQIQFKQNKSILGITASIIDKKLIEIEQLFVSFEEATKDGNYFEAREIITTIAEQIKQEKWKIDQVPTILVQIEKEIPSQLTEINEGITEMEAEGYLLNHFSFKDDIQEMTSQLQKFISLLETGDFETVEAGIKEVNQEIDQICDTLEQEVLAKQYVSTELLAIRNMTLLLQEDFFDLKNDVETIKLSYHIPEEEIKTQLKLEKQIKEMLNKLSMIEDVATNNKQANIVIKKMIEEFKSEIQEQQTTVQTCCETLNSLRVDEIKAQELLKELKAKIRDGQRLIKKSNIPGLPESLLIRIEATQTSLITATEKLESIPLVMNDVNYAMKQALETVNEIYQLISETIEKALSAERVIQYGNRFRSNSKYVDGELLRAEEAFRMYQYDEALEISLKVIEEIEPHVLEKINSYYKEKGLANC